MFLSRSQKTFFQKKRENVDCGIYQKSSVKTTCVIYLSKTWLISLTNFFFSTPMHEVINLPKNLIWYQLFYVKLKRLKDLKNIQNWTYLFRKSSYLVSKMEIGRWKTPQSKRKLIILSFQCFDIRQFSLNPWTTSEFRLFLNDFFCWWIS